MRSIFLREPRGEQSEFYGACSYFKILRVSRGESKRALRDEPRDER